MLRSLTLLSLVCSACGFLVAPARPGLVSGAYSVGGARPIAEVVAERRTVRTRLASPQMGLFGLGTPEIAVIAGIALLVLGPDQVKKLAKDVGKVSAELKQVPEEFNKGIEVGTAELEKKKAEDAAAPAAPAAPAVAEATVPTDKVA